MASTNIDDTDRTDPDETNFTPEAVIRRLERATRVLTRVNSRLAVLNAGLAPPPDPFKPTISADLAAVKAQANETLRLVGEMELKLR